MLAGVSANQASHFLVACLAAAHDREPLAHGRAETPQHKPEGRQGPKFIQEATAHYEEIPQRDRKPEPSIQIRRQVLDPHQETVLDRMHIENGGKRSAVFRDNTPHMVRDASRRIKTSPAQQLSSPGNIRIFTVGKEIRIEELAVNAIFPQSCAGDRGPLRRSLQRRIPQRHTDRGPDRGCHDRGGGDCE